MAKTKDKKKTEPKVQIEKLSSGYLVTIVKPTGEVEVGLFGAREDADYERLALTTLADVVDVLKETFQESVTPLGLDDFVPKKKKEGK